jgi:hypothetical protein
MASDHHRTGVVHMSHAYVATCACEWLGEDHPTAGPAIQEAADPWWSPAWSQYELLDAEPVKRIDG